MKLIRTPTSHPGSPFDDSAVDRQRRMGLLAQDGTVAQPAVAVFSQIYAGLFYDDLCDAHQDYQAVLAICRELVAMAGDADPRRGLLDLCVQYDTMLRPIPAPIWWIAGNASLVETFVREFARHLSKLLEQAGEGGEQEHAQD